MVPKVAVDESIKFTAESNTHALLKPKFAMGILPIITDCVFVSVHPSAPNTVCVTV